MKRFVLTLIALSSLVLCAGEPDSAALLEQARNGGNGGSYGVMEGILQHKKSGSGMEEYPVRFAVLIDGDKADAQLIINQTEGYNISKPTKIQPFGAPGIAKRVGLNPSDLTTGFLFYDFVKEEKSQRVLGVPCRVMILAAPDKKEYVKVYLAQAYAFALRAEFFQSEKYLQSGKVMRTLEVGSFQKGANDLYYAELINIYGDNWRTRVQFHKDKVTLGIPDAQTREKIFKKGKL